MHRPNKPATPSEVTLPAANDLTQLVQATGHAVLTDTRIVAKAFGKRHDNVLRDVRSLLRDVPTDFAKLNFEVCSEINDLQNGKPQQFYRLSKDGFMLLVMGFTGSEAMAMKIAFIDAFNRMAEFIQAQAAGAWEAFNRAYQQHLADRRHVSHCGRDMRRWQDVKPLQLETLERLHPQIALPFPGMKKGVLQ